MGYLDHLEKSRQDGEEAVRGQIDVAKTYDKKDAFDLKASGRRYDQQFFSMYQSRVSMLKPRVDKEALEKWGNGTKRIDGKTVHKVEKILNITSNQLCWVSGTIFCQLKNKLNILKDVESGNDDVLPLIPDSYVSAGDEESQVVMLEDESGRAILQGNEFFTKNILVTGTVVAVLGIELQAGMFEIVDIVYPKMSPQRPFKPKSSENSKVAIISGLGISTSTAYDLKIQLLQEYIQGEIGSSLGINHVIIAGNTIQEIEQKKNDDYITSNNYGTKNVSRFDSESLKLFDRFISEILSSCNVSVMPGATDPTDICLPQQSLHKSFFLSNKQHVGSHIRALTNPSWLEINGIRLLGTSGQNVDDIIKYLAPDFLQQESIITKIMESNIKWQNIAPTAPDTLYCYPFDNADPFTLRDETPQVYFVGNQNTFSSTTAKYSNNVNVKLLSIPKFHQTGEIVILDTASLEAEVIKLSV